jgi:hypothetical protein
MASLGVTREKWRVEAGNRDLVEVRHAVEPLNDFSSLINQERNV